MATPALAADLIWEGITYNLTRDSISADGKTGSFTLAISGINTASDQEGGRTSINAFALLDPQLGDAVSGTVTSPAGFNFQFGGLNSTGCNNTGNFFCFKNVGATFPSPLPSSLSLVFNVTSDTAGSWLSYAPDLKIDWLGSKNNYNLVSQPIPLNVRDNPPPPPPPPPPPAVPEPTTWAMMLAGFGFVGATMRRRQTEGRARVRFAV